MSATFAGIRWSIDPHWVILLILPFLLLLISSNWIFSPVPGIDPWVYYGYFRNFAHFERDLFPGTYYGSRLSWVLPGFLIHRFLPPLAANYVLHLTFYYLAVFSFHWILKYAAGARTAFLASLLLGCYPYFLKAIGSDYVDGAGISYYLLTAAFLTQAARRPSLLWPVLAGFFYAALLYTNLFCLTFSPFLLGYYVAARKHQGGRILSKALARSMLFGVLGFTLLTLLLGMVSYLVTGNFWFYAPSVAYALDNIGKPSPWKRETGKWLPAAYWLLLPALAALASTIFLLRSRTQKRSPVSGMSTAYSTLFVGSFAVMALLEIKANPLELDYYVSYLIPPAFLAIGSQFGSAFDRMGRTSFWFVAALVIAVCSLPPWGRTLVTGYGVLVALAFGLVWPLAVGVTRNMSRALPLVLAAIAGEYYLVSAQDRGIARQYAAKDAFVRITEAAEVIKTTIGNRNVHFWYSRNEKDFSEFYSLNSVYLWGYTGIGMDFPSLSPDARLGLGDLIVIPSAEENILGRANEALRTRRLKGSLWSRQEIRYGGVRYLLTLVVVELDTQGLWTLTVPGSSTGPQRLVPAASPAATLPLDRWELSYYADRPGRMESRPDGLYVTTARLHQAYGTMYAPLVAPVAGEYHFVLKCRLLSGGLVFGALSGDRSRWLAHATRSRLDGDRELHTFSLPLQSGQQIYLLTSNYQPAGNKSSRYVLEELRAFSDARE